MVYRQLTYLHTTFMLSATSWTLHFLLLVITLCLGLLFGLGTLDLVLNHIEQLSVRGRAGNADRQTLLVDIATDHSTELLTLLGLISKTFGLQLLEAFKEVVDQERLPIRITRSTSNRELLDMIEREIEGPKPEEETEAESDDEEQEVERPRRRR